MYPMSNEMPTPWFGTARFSRTVYLPAPLGRWLRPNTDPVTVDAGGGASTNGWKQGSLAMTGSRDPWPKLLQFNDERRRSRQTTDRDGEGIVTKCRVCHRLNWIFMRKFPSGVNGGPADLPGALQLRIAGIGCQPREVYVRRAGIQFCLRPR